MNNIYPCTALSISPLIPSVSPHPSVLSLFIFLPSLAILDPTFCLQPISMQLLWAGTSNSVVKIQTHTPPAFFFYLFFLPSQPPARPKTLYNPHHFLNRDLLQGWWSLLEENLHLSSSTATIKFCSKSGPLSILWYSIHPIFSRISWFSQFLIIPHLYPVLLYWLLHS